MEQTKFVESLKHTWTNPTAPHSTNNSLPSSVNEGNSIFEISNMFGNQTYIFDFSSKVAFRDYLDDLLTGRLWSYPWAWMSDKPEQKSLFNAGNVSQSVRNMAASMSRSMRESVSAKNSVGKVEGTGWEMVVYIEVRWWWLALPVALEISSLMFLLATIVRSRRNRVKVWKSSTLALLRSGITLDTAGLKFTETSELHEMERLADKTLVELKIANEYVGLVQCGI